MGKKERLKKFEFKDDEDDLHGVKKGDSKSVDLASSDDEEANEDLSLKIVEKALLLRAAQLVPGADGSTDVLGELSSKDGGAGVGAIKLFSASSEEKEAGSGPGVAGGNGVVAASEGRELGKKKINKRRKKKDKKLGTEEDTVVVTEEQKTELTGTIDQVGLVEPITTEITDNSVFRKLLRGPRYFDPPDSWGACFNCGEAGHNAVNCTSAKRKRPCFVCGSLEHNVKNCSKARDCFICKKGGHRAKDCPEKHGDVSSSPKVCLKCGDTGHDMYSCHNPYSDDDLKHIQCYICKKFGHLCCVNSTSNTPIEVSCYKCGQIGHTGLACSRVRGEVSGAASPNSCYKCGEEGHFARECTSSTKVGKRNRDLSNPKLRSQIEGINQTGSKSAPHDRAKSQKKKKPNYEEKCSTPLPRNSGHRGRWMMEDPGNFSNGTPKKNYWHSPVTPSPSGWARNNNYLGYSGQYASPQSSTKMHYFHQGSPMSLGSGKAFQNRFSASRFGDCSNDGRRRNYGWW